MSKLLVKFISLWTEYGKVVSDAIFDTISNTVTDIQTSDLS